MLFLLEDFLLEDFLVVAFFVVDFVLELFFVVAFLVADFFTEAFGAESERLAAPSVEEVVVVPAVPPETALQFGTRPALFALL